MAENGADIAITYQNSPERADSVVSSIEKLGRLGLAVQADSADPDAIKRAVNETVEVKASCSQDRNAE
ncbi:hypothetical protein [Virgifigura deserti]|uniref:hypothetical protein n=1 Tax=Virgifigura deserti TaxID=2268457 RepID=UPI003CCBDFA5